MRILREDSLSLYVLHIHVALFLLIYQFGQHNICYMFYILIYISHWSSFCFVAIYCIFDCMESCMFEMLCLGTLRPIYRTGVKLPSRCPILYLFNKYPF